MIVGEIYIVISLNYGIPIGAPVVARNVNIGFGKAYVTTINSNEDVTVFAKHLTTATTTLSEKGERSLGLIRERIRLDKIKQENM